ncbi:hypothetical protein TVAG_113900 [Trichomonas vaginalis G3]|uniref:Uncharacterized protein n=1 Tax=Trichomonas vaginalis (strain ATCC PRA-98 / G3) TaxID=412133 RepID=A2DNP3_TRIV3|nr:hypothetical protein TVAGG3_0608030 [Trichomonas vaginalis G3]EAY18046.1 hypothetical protein TVAG_113900 [Trichomonas vaginalis G3]KAI5524388.1 hypothetical protein TVAGG3_0608030 [Trichomonas vaginalis G3]|eukprot:XP_001579032.1 hypothetical protein [Trichomonas vaginalis G3]
MSLQSNEKLQKKCNDEPSDNNEDCWKCNSSCHSMAECVYPGNCICMHGLEGDGVNNCSVPVPHIDFAKVSEQSENFPLFVTINYSTPNNFTPSNGYGLFRDRVLTCFLSGYPWIICQVPWSFHGKFDIQISFDAIRWSNKYPISFKQAASPQPLPPLRLHSPIPREKHQYPEIKFPRSKILLIGLVVLIVFVLDMIIHAKRVPKALLPVSNSIRSTFNRKSTH